MVLLTGEAGIGKTRLAEEAAREAKHCNWTVAWSSASAQERTVPYQVWTEILRTMITQGLAQPQELVYHPLLSWPLRQLAPELQGFFPALQQEQLIAPEQDSRRLWEAIHALLRSACEQAPLLIVLDDVQWADSGSCEMLAYLVRQLRGAPILFLCTARDTTLLTNHLPLADLQREQAVELLPIAPLSTTQIHQLIAHLPASMAERISERASGNPFFAEELARSLTHGSDPHPADLEHLPETIQAVFKLRLARLSEPCHQMLERAAVLGDAFLFSTMYAMASGSTPGDEDLLIDLLEEAVRTGMLVEAGSGAHVTFTFCHPLLLTYLYESLSAARRASLHRRAAHVLQEQCAGHEAEGAAEITHHLVQGGSPATLIAHFAEMAADRAYLLSAYPLAAQHYRLALASLEQIPPETQGRQRRYPALLERLGECLMILGEYKEARQWYLHLIAELEKAPTRDAGDTSDLLALLWSEVGWSWRYVGELSRARECCERGEHILHEAGSTVGTAWASLHYQRSSICWLEGKYEEATTSAEKALALYEQALAQRSGRQAGQTDLPATRLQRTLAGDPVDLGRVHTLLASLAATIGQSAQATLHYTTALSLFEQHDRQREIARVSCNLGDVYLRQAEHALAARALQRALVVTERMGDRAALCVVEGNLGVLAHRYGKLEQADIQYRKALALAEYIKDPIYISLWQSYLSAVLHEQGRFQQASVAIRQALTIGRAIPPCLAFALIVLGRSRINRTLAQGAGNDGAYARLVAITEPTLKRALTLEGIEAEAQCDGELALAQLALLRGDLISAQRLVQRVREQAEHHEHKALQARAEEMQAAIFLQEEKTLQAIQCFELALQMFHTADMRLEWARVRMRYGAWLMQTTSERGERYQQGHHFLQEAAQVFRECQAVLDRQAVTRLLEQASEETKKL